MAAYPILRGISECAGVGGIDLAFKLLFGDAYRTVCYVEREAGSAATLVARMADATLGQAPVWDDMRTFPAEHFRGVANIIHGGIPCQPWSAAGRGLGDADPRHLWPFMLEHVRAIGPEWVFIENVPMLLRPRGYEVIKADLEGTGYRVEAGIFSAEEVGASHLRERLFILAHGEKSRGRRVSAQQRWKVAMWPTARAEDSESCGNHPEATDSLTGATSSWQTPATDSFRSRGGDRKDEQGLDQQARLWTTPQTSDTNGAGAHGDGGADLRTQVGSWATPTSRDVKDGENCSLPTNSLLSRQAPRSLIAGEKSSQSTRRLNPRFVEWLMGLPNGWVSAERINLESWETASCLLLSRLLLRYWSGGSSDD